MKQMMKQNGTSRIDGNIIFAKVDTIVMTSTLPLGLCSESTGAF